MNSGFALESTIDCKDLDEKFRFNNILGFKSFKHEETGLTVNLANVSGPLYTMAVVIPTFLNDNKGKAHTLEHLIFTGSEKYPQRGLLDKIATSCLSNGTNAYTCDDHTNYTFSTASGDGLLKLLPVFLDHILHPKIVQSTVDMEVFSIKQESNDTNDEPIISGQGVVYCEMKSRQNSEADLLDFNLRKEFCTQRESTSPILARYKWECGGLTKKIAKLSIEEILQFHRQFYNPKNVSIIISGSMRPLMEDLLLNQISSVLKSSNEYHSSERFESIPVIESEISAPSSGSRIVHFPANDETMGSIGLAWPGPDAKELTKVLSFHVIFKYLRETSSSPLHQHFVQIQNPWATDIDYEIKPFYHTLMTLIFSGVPFDPKKESRNGLVSKKISSICKDVFKDLLKDPAHFFKIIKKCIASFELKLIELIEEDPYETIISYTVPNLIISAIEGGDVPQSFGSNISTLKQVIFNLKTMTLEYWIALLEELILTEPAEVVMIPSTSLNAEIEHEERIFLKNLWKSGLTPVSTEANINTKTQSSQSNFDLMTDFSVTPFIKSITSQGLHKIELPSTSMKNLVKILNFKQFVPEQLWTYLVLYQELLFQCDLDLSFNSDLQSFFETESSSILPYQILQKALNSFINSYGINFGIDNETFSIGYCEEALIWTVSLPANSDITLQYCLNILEVVATRSMITLERVKIVAENLHNQIQDLRKDPYEIIDSILTTNLHELSRKSYDFNNEDKKDVKRVKTSETQLIFENEISMFNQKAILKKITESDDFACEVVENIEKIKQCLEVAIKEGHSFLQVGSCESVLKKEIVPFHEAKLGGRELFDVSCLPKFGRLTLVSSIGFIYPIGDITACYMSHVIPCNVLPSTCVNEESIRDYVSISLICQLLSVTEGPIYSRIRGKGLAYDASLSLSLWNGLITFSVNDSNDPSAAFIEFISLMKCVDLEFTGKENMEETSNKDNNDKNDNDIINSDAINVAKSALLYQMIEDVSNPSSMFTALFRNYLRSIPMAKNDSESDPIIEVVRAITRNDLSSAWSKYFQPFFMPGNHAISVLVVPTAISENVKKSFENLISFEKKCFKDFTSSQCQSEDGSESESDHDCDNDNSDISSDSESDSLNSTAAAAASDSDSDSDDVDSNYEG